MALMCMCSMMLIPTTAEAGWSWDCVATVDYQDRTIWIADAHRGDGRRLIVQADEKLTAFLELESAMRAATSI
jgi:hypothetical protein